MKNARLLYCYVTW